MDLRQALRTGAKLCIGDGVETCGRWLPFNGPARCYACFARAHGCRSGKVRAPVIRERYRRMVGRGGSRPVRRRQDV